MSAWRERVSRFEHEYDHEYDYEYARVENGIIKPFFIESDTTDSFRACAAPSGAPSFL
jgi:hypothetical protein